MALTRGAGIAMQIFSIPFVAYGFVGTLVVALSMLSESGSVSASWPWLAAAVASLLVGFWMLRSGKRASRLPEM